MRLSIKLNLKEKKEKPFVLPFDIRVQRNVRKIVLLHRNQSKSKIKSKTFSGQIKYQIKTITKTDDRSSKEVHGGSTVFAS